MTAQIPQEQSGIVEQNSVFRLPPLILHPFAEAQGPQRLVESSRASLMIQGLLPHGEATDSDLQRKLLDGRYAELRMLYYVGRDVQRWIEQCVDSLRRAEGISLAGVQPQSFASLLIQHTPVAVAEKLKNWGVNDFKTIFSRSLGLNAMFAKAPTADVLTEEFIRSYFRYADQLFFVYQSQTVYTQLDPLRFPFDLYSSGEYSRLLERSWE